MIVGQALIAWRAVETLGVTVAVIVAVPLGFLLSRPDDDDDVGKSDN